MVLNVKTALDTALQQGYHGRAVELVDGYSHRSTLLKMRAVIAEKIKLISGPLYSGEAEALMLLPLSEAVRASLASPGTAAVPAHAYQLAAAYSLIFDISKISQSRDIANQVTLSSMVVQPIVKAFLAKSDLQPDSDDYKNALNKIWQAVSWMGSSNVVYSPDNVSSHETPLSVLYEVTSAKFDKASLERDVVSAWNGLLSNLRHGKGTPLDKDGRRAYMAILSELLLRIDLLIDKAKDEDATDADHSASPASTTSFVDAYTAMYWLLAYLIVKEQYDVIFPSSDLMVQSQAWVLTIKTQSAKLKKFFMDVAQVAASYDIFMAMKMWEEVRAFYDPVINKTLSVVADMDSLWREQVETSRKMLSSYSAQQVDTMFASFKKYMQADYLLPQEDFQFASDIVSLYEEPEATDGLFLAKHGEQLLSQVDAVGEMPITSRDRDLIIPGLAHAAGAIEAALGYLQRSREMMQLSETTDDIYHALIPEGITWDNPYALTGTISELKTAGFEFTDPLQLCYEKYNVKPENNGASQYIASLDWKMTPLLMRPFYKIPQMQEFADSRKPESRLLWPGMHSLPVGDVITAEYIAQPLPACYTASRNANFVNNDFSAYLTLMSGRSGITASSRDMFKKLAVILDKYEDTYGRGILDALAATMFVYRLGAEDKTSEKWTPMTPTVPTVYGMPLKAMMTANKVNLTSAKDEAVLKRSLRIPLDNGNVYAFVLHNKMPKAGEFVYFAYPYAKGVYVHVPLLRSIFEAMQKRIEDALKINFSNKNNAPLGVGYTLDDLVTLIREEDGKQYIGEKAFISTLGWAPYVLNLPHMLCAYQNEENVLLSQAYRKYAMLSVKVRYDEVDRSIYVSGFTDNPVELLQMDDYLAAANEEDPSPVPQDGTTKIPEVEPDTKEPIRAEAEKHSDPTTIGAAAKLPSGDVDKDAQLKRASEVTAGPVVDIVTHKDGGSAAEVVPLSGDANASKEKVGVDPSGPINGDAAQEQPHEGEELPGRDDSAFWKKVGPDGTVLDCVRAKKCPDGYVPASEEEYRNFVQAQADGGSTKEV